jgi:hypothetical protein
MQLAAALDRIEKLLASERDAGMDALREAFRAYAPEALLAALTERIGHADPRIGATLATAGGALVEQGAPATAFGRALVGSVVAACEGARRDGPDSAAAASLAMWYRPAVACWTRDLALLREVQRMSELRDAVASLGSETETTHWLSLLFETVFDARFVALFPELGEAWMFTADGVNDMGQLTVLLSDALADPLARIAASGPAAAEALAIMRGAGPQQGKHAYSSSFHIYPRQAIRGPGGMPEDDVHTWKAPGGTGTHSLPADFLLGTLDTIDGARLITVVGPNAPGRRFVRIIPSVRTFAALPALVRDVAPADYATWLSRARAS